MRKSFTRSIKSFSRNEKGASMLEYAIIAGLIALVAIAGVSAFGTEINAAYNHLQGKVNANVTVK